MTASPDLTAPASRIGTADGSDPPCPFHTVAAGDTLFSIAQSWGVSLQLVEQANPRAGHPAGHLARIRPGDRIVHPYTERPTAYTG